MATRLAAPQIVDLVTTVETEVFQSSAGPTVWGSVEISYKSGDVEPRVTKRVAVPAYEAQSDEQRRADVLRHARNLIDHACQAIDPEVETEKLTDMIEGIAQELGVLSADANTKPIGRA